MATTPKPRKRNAPMLNKRQVQAVSLAKELAERAKSEDYLAVFIEQGITEEALDELLTKIGAATTAAGAAMSNTVKKEADTLDEAEEARKLVALMRYVQKAATRKYGRTTPVMLQDYHVGERLDQSRPVLEQYSQNFITKLGADTLPGVTPEKVAELVAARASYILAQQTQTTSGGAAMTQREIRDAAVAEIITGRIGIQLAADGRWPYDVKGNAGTRRLFKLPLRRPYVP